MKTTFQRGSAWTRRSLRAGFTLIELLAVVLILSLLVATLIPTIQSAIGTSKVTACEQNMKNIGSGFLAYGAKYDQSWPRDSGVKFFGALIGRRVWEATPQNARRLTCPSINWRELGPALDGDDEIENWFAMSNFDNVDGSYSTYAGIDRKRAKLRKFPASGEVVLVADDNDPEGNHDTATVMLMGDFSIQRLEVVDLQDKGELAMDEDVTFIPVGPSSPVEMLQNLSLD